MTEDQRRRSGANSPPELDGADTPSPRFDDSPRGGRHAASDPEPWGLGSATDSLDGASPQNRSDKSFPFLNAQLPQPLETGYVPFDLAPAALRSPDVSPPPEGAAICVGEQFAIPAKAGAVSVWLSRAAAFTAHAAVIGALIYTPATLEYGGSDVHSSAISVNVTTTQVLDSIDEKSDDSAAMQAPLAQDAPEPEPEPEKTPEPPKPEENIVLASPDAEAAPLAPEPVKPPEERKEKVEKDKKARRKKPKPEPRNVAASSGNSAKAGARGRVSASYGSVRNHDASVRARIARHIPRGLAGRGVTVIRFTISRTGALISCHIIDSSGHSALDRAALRAVRKSSPFGPPPGGQARTFTIPFIFH